jgi:hypothetical protein
METFLMCILPVILVTLECWFLRSCVRLDWEGKRVPRLLFVLVLGAPVPFLGWTIFIIMSIVSIAFLVGEDWELADNGFTRFWIKN